MLNAMSNCCMGVLYQIIWYNSPPMTKRQVFFNINHLGIVPVSVAIHSLLKHADPAHALTVHIAHDTRFAELGGCRQVEAVVKRHPFAKVRFANFDPVFERHRKALDLGDNHWSYMVWAWVFATELFPDLTGNLVFIDWDMYVTQDLAELYGLDLARHGFVTAAVNESRREHRPYLIAAGWPEAAGYSVNTGLQVIDTDAWRREHLQERILDWYARNRNIAVCVEQDAINAVAGEKILRLNVKYNYTVGWLERAIKVNPFRREWRVFPTRDVFEAMLRPAVIHFIGQNKPWRYNYRPYRHTYRAAMAELGLLENGRLPGETRLRRAIGVFYDAYHGLLRLYVRALLAVILPR